MKTRTIDGWVKYYGYELKEDNDCKTLLSATEFDVILAHCGDDIGWKECGEFFQWYIRKYIDWLMEECE
jgi:hypothetical protein